MIERRRVLEFVIALGIVATGQRYLSRAFHQPNPGPSEPSPASYVWGGGFVSYTLKINGRQYEERYNDCTTDDMLVSQGFCRWEGDELVLTVGWVGWERSLFKTPEGLVERAGLVYPRENMSYRRI